VKLLRFLVVLLFASCILEAQSPEPPAPDAQSSTPPDAPAQQSKQPVPAQPPATGSVTGHVYLGDSHLPARMAYVILLPGSGAEAGDKKPVVSTATVQTGLDGAYVIPNVLPGTYYVIAAKLGYASPLAGIDPDDYDSAPEEAKKSMAAELTPVVVTANRASTADIVLNKGAVIAGTVRFDDGESYSGAVVSLLRKDEAGKWADFTTLEGLTNGAHTDDQGNFRLTGLPAGDYLLRTTLELEAGAVNSPGADPTLDRNYRWDIYFGDGVRPRDAKTITLKDGEQSNGNEIEIRLAKLHSITGTILNVETGVPINRGDVYLHNADDDSICTSTYIGANGQFHFPYVAEGEYTLDVRNAADVVPGTGQTSDSKPIRTYADGSQPLIVKGEMNGVTIQVKPVPVAAAVQ
jgi:hypothetical protein